METTQPGRHVPALHHTAEMKLAIAAVSEAHKDVRIAQLHLQLKRVEAAHKIAELRAALGLDGSWSLDTDSFTFVQAGTQAK